jgi:hypothetical protein
MQLFLLVLSMCLVGCAGTRDVPVTRLPAARTGRADYTKGESAVCEIHQTQMQRTFVPIAYGLIRPDARAQARYAASTNSFPHTETFVLGGCVVTDDSPKKAAIYRCPECKRAADKWDSTYDKH